MTEREHTQNKYERIYTTKRNRCIELHRRGAGGIRVSSLLAETVDEVARTIYSELPSEIQSTIAVVATGGYGRRELCFGSDVDIVLLAGNSEEKKYSSEAAKQFLHRLLTLGVTVGHSFRTVDECIRIAKKIDEPAMSLMEARYICGNALVFSQFQKSMRLFVQTQSPTKMIKRIATARDERVRKYGYSSQLLEPNVKNSAGGLRDIHAALWLMYALGFCEILTPRKNNALSELFSAPAVKQLFPKTMLDEVWEAYDFLLRLRNEMHLQAHTLHDTLDFGFQPHVAMALHRGSKGKRTAVEVIMQKYHSAARSIEHFTQRLFQWASEEWEGEKKSTRAQILDDEFYVQSEKLFARTKKLSALSILRAALYQCQYGLRFSFQLEDILCRMAPTLRPTFSHEEKSILRQLFNSKHGVASVLRTFSALGLLERWIPEWRTFRAYYQHNQYHFYTADEHTLRVVEYAENAWKDDTFLGDVARKIPRKDVVLFACLFHDIAKPINLSKHDVVGGVVAKRILHRLGFTEISDDVAFLVRHHLLMEQVAFRRDLDDPQTIASFGAHVGTIDRLRYLFVLTNADLASVNPNVLTSWKQTLLQMLYRQTLQYLEERWTLEQLLEYKRRERHETKQQVLKKLEKIFGRERVEQHLALIHTPEYIRSFTADEIGEHITTIQHLASTQVRWVQRDHWTEITFFANDAPGLLSKFCGILTVNDCNILDAQIFTRADGIVIDKFRVVNFTTRSILQEETLAQIKEDVRSLENNTLNLQERLALSRERWKRQVLRTSSAVPKIDVSFSEHPHYTIIDVFGPDTIGFLYMVTSTLAELECDIRFAKIATRLDGVVDTFYVVDSNGTTITSEARREDIRKRILETVTHHFSLER